MATVTMSSKELERLHWMGALAERRATQREVASHLGLSVRQVQRIRDACVERGGAGLVSERRGKPSNRTLPSEFRAEVLGIVRTRYAGFGPTLAHEKLVEQHGLGPSLETLRVWMSATGLWRTRKERRSRPQQPRQRRACVGELVQIDGSDHEWFEERGPRCTLLVYVDDATSRLQELRFAPESTFDYFESTRRYLGNAFLEEFGEDYNRRFAREPQSAHDAHRPLLAHESLAETFTLQETRKVSANLTLHYNRVMYLLDPEGAEDARRKHVEVRESRDGAVRIFLGDVELPARPFPKDNRVSQGAIVSHKLLAGALTVIQGQQQERDRQRLEGRLTRRERSHLQGAMNDAWPDVAEGTPPPPSSPVVDSLLSDALRALAARSA